MLPVYNAGTTLGYTLNGRISVDNGEKAVADGVMRRVEMDGQFYGYQLLEKQHVADDVPSVCSPAGISARESQLNAGTAFKGSRSRTMRMSPDDPRRLTRVHGVSGAHLPAEDAVERAVAKVHFYPLVEPLPVAMKSQEYIERESLRGWTAVTA